MSIEDVPDDPPMMHLYVPQELPSRATRRLGEALVAQRALTAAEADLYRRFSVDAMERTTACTEAIRSLLGVDLFKEVLPRVTAARVTGRPKTRKTLVEKLQRTPEIKLPAVHDVAGVRLVGGFSVFEQQQAAVMVRTSFDGVVAMSRPTQLIDRLEVPAFGYRALHVLLWPEGRPVEVQIRTELQHAWAELMEVLTDRWGREPRYGLPVNHPDDQERDRRQSIVDQLIAISDNIAAFEEAEARSAAFAHVHPPMEAMQSVGLDTDDLRLLQEQARDVEPEVEAMKQNLLRALTQFGVDADLESDY